ncbi:TraR/DksA family transcriptional regulator [Saccharopolyspora erythraea]|nr:TraR/DksA C4-type zinc finger protein [Saccharopolyspora erythraea]
MGQLIASRRTGVPEPRRHHEDFSRQREYIGSLAAHLPALRSALEQQLAFRREQLTELEARSRTGTTARHAHQEAGAAIREVNALMMRGARRALADIEVALARMRDGMYGLCRACGSDIPLQLLTAIPKTTLCLSCQRTTG